jgi:SAM-dependent methyltransferase
MLRLKFKNLRKGVRRVQGRTDSGRGSGPERSKVTPEMVTWGYRLFLDRDPENRHVVEDKVSRIATIKDLRQEFLTSAEFVANDEANKRRSLPCALDGNEPPMHVEEVDGEQDLTSILDHIQRCWQQLGETEPHWSVCSSDRFLQSQIQETKDEFYNSGRYDVARLLLTLERNGIDPTAFRTCLEYGCGLGRVTAWLAERFESVYGYDISLAHLQSTENYLAQRDARNVILRHIRSVQDIFQLQKSDIIYSVLVLQHNPPPIIRLIVREFLRALNPGGVAFFQVPTYRQGYSFTRDAYLNNEATNHETMEMHVLPQRVIFEIAAQEGGQVVEVLEDGYTGFPFKEVSNTFLIQKRV